jgi:hypothetical protein
MTPKVVTVLDEWITKGGALPEGIPHDYVITTVDEANANCRALSSGLIYAINSIRLPALHGLLAFLQSAETDEARSVFRGKGLPFLRRILSDALDRTRVADGDDRPAEEGRGPKLTYSL